MKASTFATKIKALKPDRSTLADKGLPEEFIEELRSSYDSGRSLRTDKARS